MYTVRHIVVNNTLMTDKISVDNQEHFHYLSDALARFWSLSDAQTGTTIVDTSYAPGVYQSIRSTRQFTKIVTMYWGEE